MSAAVSWETFKPGDSNPAPSLETVAHNEARSVVGPPRTAREHRLIEALETALLDEARLTEIAELEQRLVDAGKEYDEEIDASGHTIAELKGRITELLAANGDVAKVGQAQVDAARARLDADHWREMHGRATKEGEEARASLRELRESVRALVGDSPDALAVAAYWRDQARLHGTELMTLRRRVAELEAPSGRTRKIKEVEQDRDYWKAKALAATGAQ